MIRFPKSKATLTNALSGGEYRMIGLHRIQPTDKQLENITRICNEPTIFENLFAPLFSGKPYPIESARQWIKWAHDGWANNTHFVFVVLDPSDLIVATCDLKSAEPTEAEFGYWASSSHPGIITDAVRKMLDLAQQAGFKQFFAEVKQDNLKSLALQKRLGFQSTGESKSRPNHLVFRKSSQE